MRVRALRLLALAWVAWGICVAPAAGQQGGPTGSTGSSGAAGATTVPGGTPEDPAPVAGGGSFATAPTLAAGTYRDTVVPAENTFYAVELKAGQQLRLRAELDTDPDTFNDTGVTSISPVFYTPLREVVDAADGFISATRSADLTLSRVETLRDAGNSGVAYLGPGTWFIGFTSLYRSQGDPPRAEVPLRFTVDIEGEPIREEAETFPDAPKPAASQAPAEPATVSSSSASADGHLLRNTMIGVAGVLLGTGIGLLVGARRSAVG